jgi:peptidoglycan/xylan/chitin deacetylase (PgdA/CDA1 family)
MKKWYLILPAILLAITGILFVGKSRQTAAENAYAADAADAVKQIAITFDDGPNPDYTPELLEGLKKRGVKATFFVLGEEVELYPDILKEIYEDGHLIGIHSYQHVDFTEIGDTASLEQINRTQEAIYAVTGEYAGYIRPPYGSWRKELDAKVPLIEVLWSVDPMDWATNDADTVVQRIESHVEEGSIILLHDASESTVQAAFRTIDLLQEQGYTFVTVETLLIE